MATIIDTGLTTAGLKGNFFSALKAVDPFWRKVATAIKSTGPSENYQWLGTVPQMRPWGSGRLAKGLTSESYSVENHKYEATIEVDRDEFSDDQLGQIRIRVRDLARRSATHPDKLLAVLLANGDQSGYEGYDAVEFFSDSHPNTEAGNQSNVLSVEVTDSSDVSTDDFGSCYQQAVQTLLAIKDDQGEPINEDLSGLIAVVPPALWYPAKQALLAETISSSSNILAGEAQVAVFPRLTDGTTWFLCRTDTEVRPFIFQDREPLEFSSLAEGSEEAFKREKYLYGARARYAMAYGYWQYCIQAQFTEAS